MEQEANYTKSEALAKHVIEDNCILEAPVNIVNISENYGLSIFIHDFENTFESGMLNFKEKKVYISEADNPRRRRFTLAHELGHFLLHKELDRNFIHRKSPIAGNKEEFEKEADAFAAHLLVPLAFLKKDKDKSISLLSKTYDVSEDVVGYQLKRLNK